jgi:hypothetical protein
MEVLSLIMYQVRTFLTNIYEVLYFATIKMF